MPPNTDTSEAIPCSAYLAGGIADCNPSGKVANDGNARLFEDRGRVG